MNDPLIKQITCSLSEKVQLESIGGPKYSSVDFFDSESEQVLASMDEEEVRQVWLELRRRVEGRIKERKQALKDEFANVAPF